jgi:hypothetical protein
VACGPAGAEHPRADSVGGAGLPLAGYGVGLLASPATVTGFWPWPIDAFQCRIYSAIFLTLALASALAARAV